MNASQAKRFFRRQLSARIAADWVVTADSAQSRTQPVELAWQFDRGSVLPEAGSFLLLSFGMHGDPSSPDSRLRDGLLEVTNPPDEHFIVQRNNQVRDKLAPISAELAAALDPMTTAYLAERRDKRTQLIVGGDPLLLYLDEEDLIAWAEWIAASLAGWVASVRRMA
ncbi:MAG: hypothetical protein WCD35_05735 [Mycobacteriales bacterium]